MPETSKPQAQRMHEAPLVPVALRRLQPVPPRATTSWVLPRTQSQPSTLRLLSRAPRSCGLGSTSGYQPGKGSSLSQSEKYPQQNSQVVESLWDNPEFIQLRFYIGRFITTPLDTEADQGNIKALYSSALKSPYDTFSAWI
jgi:hypothetical protein